MSNEGALRQRSNRNSNESIESNEGPAQSVCSPSPVLNELRLVLLGKTGAGKSATGNSILGNRCFDEKLNMSSVTKHCKQNCETVEGRKLVLVDTPDFTDLDQTLEEIQRCLALCSPGPHAFLLVVPIERYTEEQQRTVEMILEMFHEDIDNYGILIFSHADRLGGESIEGFISRQNRKVHELVGRFGRRFVAFDNTNPTNRDQVRRLLQKVDELLAVNENCHFTNEVTVQEAQRIREETMLAVMAKTMRKIKEEVRTMADVRWRAIVSDMNEQRQKTEQEKKHIQDRIDQIDMEIMKEEQNVQPITARLRRFRVSLQEEQDILRRLQKRGMEKERQRIKRKKKEKKDLKNWIQEEVQRKLSEAGQNNQHSLEDNNRIYWIFLLVFVGFAFIFILLALVYFLFRTEQSSSDAQSSAWQSLIKTLFNSADSAD